MERIEARQVSHLVVTRKDRPVRFGIPWFERCRAEHGTELLVLKQQQFPPEHRKWCRTC
jgi:predicted site-specific integrase-resolvase